MTRRRLAFRPVSLMDAQDWSRVVVLLAAAMIIGIAANSLAVVSVFLPDAAAGLFSFGALP